MTFRPPHNPGQALERSFDREHEALAIIAEHMAAGRPEAAAIWVRSLRGIRAARTRLIRSMEN